MEMEALLQLILALWIALVAYLFWERRETKAALLESQKYQEKSTQKLPTSSRKASQSTAGLNITFEEPISSTFEVENVTGTGEMVTKLTDIGRTSSNVSQVSSISMTETPSIQRPSIPTTSPVNISNPSLNQSQSQAARLFKICLTGGPCAGKTTALSHLNEMLTQNGFMTFAVPEAATLLARGGVDLDISGLSMDRQVAFQTNLLCLQMALEDTFIDMALQGRLEDKCVILCDRGTMDGAAYTTKRAWQAVLDGLGKSDIQIRNNRYDAVIHLVTAAKGAEKFYTGTAVRKEDLNLAKEMDSAVQNAWLGHPHHMFISNDFVTSFDEKITEVEKAVRKVVGLSNPVHFHKKFLVNNQGTVPLLPEDLNVEKIIEEVTYLITEKGLTSKVKRRGTGRSFSYTHNYQIQQGDAKVEKRRIISSREYMQLSQVRDVTRKIIHKIRQFFVWGSYCYTMDTYVNLLSALTLLRIDTETPSTQLEIPPFIEVIREVTNEQGYMTHVLAKKDYYVEQQDLKYVNDVQSEDVDLAKLAETFNNLVS